MITITATQAIADLNLILARLQNPRPALDAIGAAEAENIRVRIQEGKRSPDGVPWAEWTPFTRAEREAKGNTERGLLWDSGTLLDSIRHQSGAADVVIGTDVDYADELQDGRVGMRARPFVGWDADGIRHAEMTMMHFLEGML